MIGSHNTMTYLPVKQWYYKPFKFVAKCQSKSLKEQFTKYNVRFFDFRIRFDKHGEPVMAHGPIEFKGDVLNYLEWLNSNSEKDVNNVYVRLILESNKPMKDQDVQEALFREFCEYVINKYTNITFFGGRRKYDWKYLYEFFIEPDILDKYSSTTNIFGGSKDSFIAKIDDFWPWLYAKIWNKKNLKKYKDNLEVLFIDFVNIK